eukprot:g4342.t1
MTVLGELPATRTNRCSDYDLSPFTNNAINCGAPLSLPCFNFSRCRDGPSVYVYDKECSLKDSSQIDDHGMQALIRGLAKDEGILADTYESACSFISINSREELQCAITAPLWDEGRNHVMLDVHDNSRDKRTGYFGSYAIQAANSQHTCYYRTGYDISIGHGPRVVFHELQSTHPRHRQYFLTFRGTQRLNYHGSEERRSIQGLHDPTEGIVVAMKCPDNNSRAKTDLAHTCGEMKATYDAYDYGLMMNSTFALVPAGASPGTYRLGEVMSAGCIPVFVARDYVKPFPELVDWSSFSFTFAPDQVPDMLRTLRSVPPKELEQMQKNALEAYWKIYDGTGYGMILRHVLDIFVGRMRHRET